jgi:hypothetical protein
LEPKVVSNHDYLVALLFAILAAFLSAATYWHLFDTNFFVGPFFFNHWLTIIGTSYIAIATPTFVLLKRYYPLKLKLLLRFHIFGNLILFMLIAIHVAGQTSRTLADYPSLGLGLAMFIALTLEVISGFVERFPVIPQISPKTNKFIHASLVMVFYLVIGFHVLHVLGYI